jgi:uncharacterized membrane protein SirB2
MQASLLATLYPGLLHAHIGLVLLTGGYFALRWLAVLAGARWPLQRLWRTLSMVIDSALLLAGATLWWLLQIHPVQQPWLGTKLGLLLVYIVLGTFALKRGRTRGHKLVFGVLALGVLGFMVSVAQARHPLGWWLP